MCHSNHLATGSLTHCMWRRAFCSRGIPHCDAHWAQEVLRAERSAGQRELGRRPGARVRARSHGRGGRGRGSAFLACRRVQAPGACAWCKRLRAREVDEGGEDVSCALAPRCSLLARGACGLQGRRRRRRRAVRGREWGHVRRGHAACGVTRRRVLRRANRENFPRSGATSVHIPRNMHC